MAGTATAETSEKIELKRVEIPVQPGGGVKVDEKTGDVIFTAVAVDKQKKPNRRGFIFDWATEQDVILDGWLKNPVILWRHDSCWIPVGMGEQVAVTRKDVRIRARIPNYSEDPNPALVELDRYLLGVVRGAVQKGLVKAVSIGFYIRKSEPLDAPGDDRPVRAEKVTRFEIVEVSVVSIGAHETALIQQDAFDGDAARQTMLDALGGRHIEREDGEGETLYRLCLDTAEEAEDEAEPEEQGGAPDENEAPALQKGGMTEIVASDGGHLIPSEIVDEHPEAIRRLTALVEQANDSWKAIPYSRHGDEATAPESTAWDGPGEAKTADADDLKVMCALENTDAPDKKTSYKLPHHRANGNRVVWKGVAAAMAVLLGARGGVKGVGAEARKGAHAHLSKHYKQFGKEAPAFKQDYSADDLAALADEGLIEIPGRDSPPTGAADTAALEAQLAALENRVTVLEVALCPADDAEGEEHRSPDDEPSAPPADEQAGPVAVDGAALLDAFRDELATAFHSPTLQRLGEALGR